MIRRDDLVHKFEEGGPGIFANRSFQSVTEVQEGGESSLGTVNEGMEDRGWEEGGGNTRREKEESQNHI